MPWGTEVTRSVKAPMDKLGVTYFSYNCKKDSKILYICIPVHNTVSCHGYLWAIYAIASIAVMRLHAYYIEPSILVATPRWGLPPSALEHTTHHILCCVHTQIWITMGLRVMGSEVVSHYGSITIFFCPDKACSSIFYCFDWWIQTKRMGKTWWGD